MASLEALDEFCESKFWDANLTWYTTDPELTECFQNTVLVWIPCIFLWLFAPIEVITSIKSKNGFIPWTSLNIAKIIITTTLGLLSIIKLGYANVKDSQPAPVLTQAGSLELITYLLVIGLVLNGRKRGVQNSAILFVFWFLAFLCGLLTYCSLLKTLHNKYLIKDSVLFTLYMVQYPLIVSMLALSFMIDERPTYRKRYETFHEKQSPELTASFPSKLLFFWTFRILWAGWKKPITFNDVFDLNYSEKSATVCRKFERYWDPPCRRRPQVYKFDTEFEAETELNGVATEQYQNVPKSKIKEKYSILPAMIKTFWPYFLFSALIRLVFDLLQFTNPIILRWLIEYATSDEPIWKGYAYVVLLALANTVQYLFGGSYYRRVIKLGLRLRSLSMSTIYKKTLRLSNSARRNLTIGVILNAMSVDSDRFPMLMMEINMLWSAPLKIALSLYFLWEVLGASTFAGLAIMLLMMPLNGVLARKIKRLQAKIMVCKDERIKLMSEVLNGIKVLKLYGWEQSFQDKVSELRNREVSLLKKMQYLSAFTTSLWQLTPFLVAVVSFSAFVLIDENNVLTATIAFVSLRLFNMLKDPLTDIPDTINYIIVTRVGIKRINLVLNSEELEEYVQGNKSDSKNVIDIKNASFRWDETGNAILKNINLKVAKGSLVAVVGQVGCGKSSLISSILGDMDKMQGQVQIQGSIAYVPQQAWIQNATLRNNIIFDQTFDAVKYNKIVESCTLDVDFNILPANDVTEIGEKGINLSGGQKQRVSLARAVYRDADIYLLDDPLGAVDSHVGKFIFDKVLGPNGILRQKTRILVTHSVTFLPEVDYIYVMKNGEISESGSYQEIISSNGAFKDFLLQHFNEETLKNDDERSVLSYIADHTKSPELSRQVSQLSKASVKSKSSESLKPKVKDDGKQLVKEEKEFFGSTSCAVYRQYFATMRIVWCILIVLGFAAQQGFSVGSNFWLIIWSGDSERNFTDTDDEISTRNLRIGVYAALGGAQSLVLMASFVVLAITGLRSSTALHLSMLTAILRSPMSFFDTTPMGRILNRFAKDVDGTDMELPTYMRRFLTVMSQIVGFLVAIVIEIPSFLYAVLPIAVVYGFTQRLYLATNRQLKRMEANSRSPLYAHFSESLSGASSIRAYGATTRFVLQSEKYIDNNTKLRYMMRVTNRWLSVNLDMVGSFILFFAGLFTILSKGKLSSGSVGFIITNANNLIGILFSTVLASSNFENALVSVERLTEYCNLNSEASWENPETKPKKSWPEQGKIVFHNYSTRYRKGLELVLRNISFVINPSEKVGVVGRTGAGKSSLTLAMFRIIEPVTGQIFIDDVDITRLGLFDLRSKLTIIPQDPVLFSGSLRLNLDPFSSCTDEELWSALELSHLKSFIQTLDKGLDYDIAEGGENLSVGQRQLVCLARALLRKTKVLVLDEATASVDLDTDDLIQATIRREFQSCTVVTIAHRLNTIMDYDRVIVLDKGTILEFDTPSNLLDNNDSVFYGMAKDAGLV